MKIGFSRHAKRRARLYGIPEAAVADILAKKSFGQGLHEIVEHVAGWRYPLKIVVSVEMEGHLTVVTAYPLKKGRGK